MILYPDFTNSLINLTSSIKKHFNKNLKLDYPSIEEVDKIIEGYKKVAIILLDGMGVNIINGNLGDDSFLKRHMVHQMTSIFPPTTVAATNCILQGRLPGEDGWFGWHQYFSDNNHHVIMFKDEDYYTGEKVDPSIKNRYVLNDHFGYKLGVNYYELFPSFIKGGLDTFDDMATKLLDILSKDETSYTYAYWDYPDALIHEYGCYNAVIKANLCHLSESLERIEKNLLKDAIVLVIADHGLIDVSGIDLYYYQNINKYFKRLPSLEGRATIFKVNDKLAFKEEFEKAFGKWFDLYSKEEFLKLGLVGKTSDKILPFLADYICLAKDKYYFYYSCGKDDCELMKGHHAGITKDEMIIPLIVIK